MSTHKRSAAPLPDTHLRDSHQPPRHRSGKILAARLRLAQFATNNTLKDFLQLALDEAELLTGSQIGFYHFVNEAEQTLQLQTWSTNTRRYCQADFTEQHYPIAYAGIWADCVRQRKAIIHNDYPSYPQKKGLPDGHATILRELIVPLFRNNQIVALVGVGNKPHPYTQTDVELVALLADLSWDLAERKKTELALREHEARLQEAVQIARLGHYSFDIPANRWDSSQLLDEIFGIQGLDYQKDAYGWLEIVHPEQRQAMQRYLYTEVLEQKQPFDKEYRIRRQRDGQSRWVHGTGRLECDEQGRPLKLIGTIQDITERKHSEEALKASEERYRQLVELSPDAIGILVGERLVFINHAGLRLLGATSEKQLLGQVFTELVEAEVQGSTNSPDGNHQATLLTTEKITCLDGQVRYVEISTAPFNYRGAEATHIIIHDITSRKKAEDQLMTALNEKEILLRELYHRTKNNMQVIIALLELEADHNPASEVSGILREMENRINSMSLVHQMLYQSQNLSSINLKDYIQDLVALLMHNQKREAGEIQLKLELAEVYVNIDTAIPCGLILNEIFTNVYKHAFPDQRAGQVTIRLFQSNVMVSLEIIDNGVGFPPGFDYRTSNTLGLQTILALAEHQLQGNAIFNGENGVSCLIVFRNE